VELDLPLRPALPTQAPHFDMRSITSTLPEARSPFKIQPDNLHFVCVLVVGTRSRSTRSIIFALSEVSLARPVPALVQCKHHCIRSCTLTLVVLPE